MLRAIGSKIKAALSAGGVFTGLSSGGQKLPLPYALAKSSVPRGIAPSGLMGDNGAVTLGTALQIIYAGIYLYFPANAISAGSAAGLYWTVMSSTTVGQVYNNLYTAGDPAPVTAPTPFVTTGPGAYVQTTAADIVLHSSTLPGATLSSIGRVIMRRFDSVPNTAGVKLFKQMYGGQLFGTAAGISTSANLGEVLEREFGNRGLSLQVSAGSALVIALGGATILTLTVNSAVDQTITLTAQLATATDYAILEMVLLEVYP